MRLSGPARSRAGRAIPILSASLLLLALPLGGVAPTPEITAGGPAKSHDVLTVQPNIVLILTDDQRFDELSFMPNVQADLIDKGVSFSPNAVISDALCCPSRATILTGTYSHTNGIYQNAGNHGGFSLFTSRGDDQNTIATVLQDQGYRTGLVGKYLNNYLASDASYVPPGWDSWFAMLMGQEKGYYNWQASDQGTVVNYGSDPSSYNTTVLDEQALAFLRSVDDMVGDVMNELKSDGRLANIFLSDQGIELGSHRWEGKEVPYEESIRTPLIIRWDALNVVPRTDGSLVSNVDLAQTMAAAAGTTMPGAEGMNLLPLLEDPTTPWRQDLLLEHAKGAPVPAYCGVRSTSYVYAQYATGEEELYDLAVDPSELENVATDPDYASVLLMLRAEDHALCDPLPPGFQFTH